MEGMILAAGLGTRLRPLTDTVPKALVEVDGVAQIDRTLSRLRNAGCDRVVVNVHHHASLIERYLAARCSNRPVPSGDVAASYEVDGVEVLVSREEAEPLDTGGGILHASHLFRGDRAILVHNVDVISSVDLGALAEAHGASDALATLAVQRRAASRYLVFDASGLCGRIDARSGGEEWAREPSGPSWRTGFTGIHAISPLLPGRLTERGVFSITDAYLRLASEGGRILPFDVTGVPWFDIGTPDRLDAARRRVGKGTANRTGGEN
jgi:NDP-sugar pyrophosphorylase family protein